MAGLLMIGLAVVVYRAGPRNKQNRLVAVFVLLLGLGEGLATGLRFMTDDAAAAFGLWRIRTVCAVFGLTLFVPAFIGTLPIRRTRFLSTTPALVAEIAVGIAFAALSDGLRSSLVGARFLERVDVWFFPPPAAGPQLVILSIYLIYFLVLLALPAASIAAMRNVRSRLGREKIRWLLYGITGWSLLYGGVIFGGLTYGYGVARSPVATALGDFYLSSLAMLVLATCIGMGVLRAQLFDIDLKIKWTLRKGTVVGFLLGVFFIVGLAASEFLIDELGYGVGALAAGILLLALRPLDRLGSRLANAAMPNVSPTSEYVMLRKHEVYQAAYESAAQDGTISETEKDVLATLATSLRLAPAEVRAIEKGVA